MNRHEIVVGVDPDSEKLGVAEYKKGTLVKLKSMYRIELIDEYRYKHDVIFSIEDTTSTNAIFGDGLVNRARSVGKVQQAQIELTRDLDYYGMPYILQKISSKWKGDKGSKSKKQAEKREFSMVTGWKKKSNPDTRSAAYMGFLAINNRGQNKNESEKS